MSNINNFWSGNKFNSKKLDCHEVDTQYLNADEVEIEEDLVYKNEKIQNFINRLSDIKGNTRRYKRYLPIFEDIHYTHKIENGLVIIDMIEQTTKTTVDDIPQNDADLSYYYEQGSVDQSKIDSFNELRTLIMGLDYTRDVKEAGEDYQNDSVLNQTFYNIIHKFLFVCVNPDPNRYIEVIVYNQLDEPIYRNEYIYMEDVIEFVINDNVEHTQYKIQFSSDVQVDLEQSIYLVEHNLEVENKAKIELLLNNYANNMDLLFKMADTLFGNAEHLTNPYNKPVPEDGNTQPTYEKPVMGRPISYDPFRDTEDGRILPPEDQRRIPVPEPNRPTQPTHGGLDLSLYTTREEFLKRKEKTIQVHQDLYGKIDELKEEINDNNSGIVKSLASVSSSVAQIAVDTLELQKAQINFATKLAKIGEDIVAIQEESRAFERRLKRAEDRITKLENSQNTEGEGTEGTGGNGGSNKSIDIDKILDQLRKEMEILFDKILENKKETRENEFYRLFDLDEDKEEKIYQTNIYNGRVGNNRDGNTEQTYNNTRGRDRNEGDGKYYDKEITKDQYSNKTHERRTNTEHTGQKEYTRQQYNDPEKTIFRNESKIEEEEQNMVVKKYDNILENEKEYYKNNIYNETNTEYTRQKNNNEQCGEYTKDRNREEQSGEYTKDQINYENEKEHIKHVLNTEEEENEYIKKKDFITQMDEYVKNTNNYINEMKEYIKNNVTDHKGDKYIKKEILNGEKVMFINEDIFSDNGEDYERQDTYIFEDGDEYVKQDVLTEEGEEFIKKMIIDDETEKEYIKDVVKEQIQSKYIKDVVKEQIQSEYFKKSIETFMGNMWDKNKPQLEESGITYAKNDIGDNIQVKYNKITYGTALKFMNLWVDLPTGGDGSVNLPARINQKYILIDVVYIYDNHAFLPANIKQWFIDYVGNQYCQTFFNNDAYTGHYLFYKSNVAGKRVYWNILYYDN